MKSLLLIVIFVALLLPVSGSSQTNDGSIPNPPPEDPARILQFLSQTITWYRQSAATEQQLAGQPSDLTFVDENRRVADQVVQLAFEYARAQAQLQARPSPSQTSSSPANSGLTQGFSQTEQQIRDTQQELQQVRQKLGSASRANRRTLEAQSAELESELGLLEARRDALASMLEFTSASQTGKSRGLGLRAQVEELARSVAPFLSQPGASNPQPSSQPSAAGPNNVFARRAEPVGIWGLGADLFHLIDNRHSLEQELASTAQLSQTADELRRPLLAYLSSLIHQGEQLFRAADTAKAGELVEQKRQLDGLTAQFKQASTQLLPLSKALVLTDVYKRSLNNWRASVKKEENDELRQLLLRVGGLAILVSLVFIIGELWRRTTFRYIHDARRRYQFLLLRRVVLGIAIALIVLLTFASQLGSAVTFAGLITAGVAVALQNVILSVVAYFFLIGKYGIRVGDRVQIAGVWGEVVDLGLVRLHLMELSGQGEAQPTGRIVAFSNSIVLQPSAGVFKQIPGTDFIWHEVRLTLSAEADYQTAKTRIKQAVDQALAESHQGLEAQRRMMERLAVSPTELRPRIGLRYTTGGIEATVRFPVEQGKAGEMDDALMKELISSLEQDPPMKVLSTEMPTPA